MFLPGHVYKHENNTDVGFIPISCAFIDHENEYTMFGYWLNVVNPDNTFLLNTDRINIKQSDTHKWVLLYEYPKSEML